MSRNLLKGPYINYKLFKKITNNTLTDIYKTWARNTIILPLFVGKTLSVYNGKKHINILIVEDMVGHKLGEFSITRTFKAHKTLDKKLKKK